MIVTAGRRSTLPDTSNLSLREAQRVWAVAAQGGNHKAFEKLMESTDRYIFKIAVRWAAGMLGEAPSSHDVRDMMAECHVKLFDVLDRFDAERGCWMTFAHWWVKHSVSRWVSNQGRSMRVPEKRRWVLAKKAYRKLLGELGREPTDEEISAECGVPAHKIAKDRAEAAVRIESADAPMHTPMDVEGQYDSLLVTIASQETKEPLEQLLATEGADRVRAWVRMLPPKDREVVRRRFGLGRERAQILSEIGAHLGLSRERVRQIELRAMERLRRLASRDGWSSR